MTASKEAVKQQQKTTDGPKNINNTPKIMTQTNADYSQDVSVASAGATPRVPSAEILQTENFTLGQLSASSTNDTKPTNTNNSIIEIDSNDDLLPDICKAITPPGTSFNFATVKTKQEKITEDKKIHSHAVSVQQ